MCVAPSVFTLLYFIGHRCLRHQVTQIDICATGVNIVDFHNYMTVALFFFTKITKILTRVGETFWYSLELCEKLSSWDRNDQVLVLIHPHIIHTT